MNILSQNGAGLVNYNNIITIYIDKEYQQYSSPDTWWQIKAIGTTMPEDVTSIILAKFDDEKKCESVFKRIVNEICEQKLDLVVI